LRTITSPKVEMRPRAYYEPLAAFWITSPVRFLHIGCGGKSLGQSAIQFHHHSLIPF